MNERVGMVCLGCAKNRVDGEMMLYNLREAGYELVADVANSEVAIVNTCGFIEDAKQESIDEILELAELKKEGKIKAIIVTGCLAERYRREVMKELYEEIGEEYIPPTEEEMEQLRIRMYHDWVWTARQKAISLQDYLTEIGENHE